MAVHNLHHPHYHHLHLLLLVQCFIVNLRLGSLENPFLQETFSSTGLILWTLGPFNVLFCSTAGFVCMVC